MGMIRMEALNSRRGLTLVELLVVIVVVAVLAAIAVPIYTGYMQRARRVDAKTALEQLRASQEMRRAERGRYAGTLVEVQTTWGGPVAAAGDYTITMVANTAAGTFMGTATPNTSRQTSDGALTIDQDGTKSPLDKWVK